MDEAVLWPVVETHWRIEAGAVRDADVVVLTLERVQLEHDAWLQQGGNEISGELIHYDMVAGRVNAESGEEGPVTVTVQPAARSE